jgi:hypothetical protein
MLNIRTFTFSIVLVVIFVLTVALVSARTEDTSHTSSSPATASEVQQRLADKHDTYRVPSYRSQFGECYDVPIRELAACRRASPTSVQKNHTPIDECIDVSLWEVAGCRKASQAPAP